MNLRTVLPSLGVLAAGVAALMVRPAAEVAAEPAASVKLTEKERVAVVNKVKPAVVSVFAKGQTGGGSGVLIDADGYALTNFHVVQGTGPTMVCGLNNGVLYDTVLVGLDKVGDVALIKMLPKKEGDKFPFVELGDSDAAKVGDWSLAMGNPFGLAMDFTPSISYGLISGVNRYQYPSGGFLEYTDCIQFDTTINPGNSGGPLFDMGGKLIGINGRGSFAQDKRFRINCGVGYAISINQIKNFLGHLRAGIDTDHATLGAALETASEDAELSHMIVREVLDESDVARRGIVQGDELVSFASRPLTSVNQYKNVLGIFPKEWRMPMVYRRNNEKKEVLVRLMGLQASEKEPKKGAGAPPPAPAPVVSGPAAKFYKAKPGYANYYFNEQSLKNLLANFKKIGDFTTATGEWSWEGTYDRENRTYDFKASVVDKKDGTPVVKFNTTNGDYDLEPVKVGLTEADRLLPAYSGGLMNALYHYRRFLTLEAKGFEKGAFVHGGVEPAYVVPADGKVKEFKDIRVMGEVVRTEHVDIPAKWYFYRADLNPRLAGKHPYPDYALFAAEVSVGAGTDPCELYFSDFKAVGGRQVPHKMEVRFQDKRYGLFDIKTTRLN